MRRRRVSQVLCLCLALVTALSLTVSLVAAQDGGRRKDRNQAADEAPASSESGLVDSDADYLPDYMDNCPFVQNPNQPDDDGDGIGNHCDDTPQGETPAPPEQVEVTGPAEAERTDQTTWDPGVVTVDDAAAGEETASTDGTLGGDGDGGEPIQEIELASSQSDPGATDATAAGFAATDSGVAGPPGYSSVFVPPGIPVDDGQSEPREPPDMPEEAFAVIARIDAGVVAPRDGARAEPVGSVARDVDVAAFMRKEKKSPTLTDLGLQSTSHDLLPDPSPTPTPEPAPAPPPAAVTAAEVTESLGAPPAPDWDYDAYYAGGLARDRLEVPDIEGTDEPELYFSQRRGDARGKPGEFSYAIPVPEDGVYQVRLHFAEIYWGAEGGGPGGRNKRVFSVDAEGDQVLADYDIYEDVGAMTAVVKQFSIEVDDGVLDLRFYGKRDQPMVAGIEVLGAPQGERWVDVRMAERVVRLMVGGTVVAEYAASFGEPGHATPTGTFQIQNKIAGLSWSPYAQNYFTYWAAFDQANELGFHSWTMDASGQLVGNADGPTWGCIATAPADAAAIYDFVTEGTRVEISS